MLKPRQDQVKYLQSIKPRLHKMQVECEQEPPTNKIVEKCLEILDRKPESLKLKNKKKVKVFDQTVLKEVQQK